MRADVCACVPQFGGAGTAAIAPMLKIGQRMKADEFSKEIVPGVVRCFKSTDRATRIGLLQNMHTFAEHLTPALVENDVFPNLSSGFTDSVPALRELTVWSREGGRRAGLWQRGREGLRA